VRAAVNIPGFFLKRRSHCGMQVRERDLRGSGSRSFADDFDNREVAAS
jgi:hypothetical protein